MACPSQHAACGHGGIAADGATFLPVAGVGGMMSSRCDAYGLPNTHVKLQPTAELLAGPAAWPFLPVAKANCLPFAAHAAAELYKRPGQRSSAGRLVAHHRPQGTRRQLHQRPDHYQGQRRLCTWRDGPGRRIWSDPSGGAPAPASAWAGPVARILDAAPGFQIWNLAGLGRVSGWLQCYTLHCTGLAGWQSTRQWWEPTDIPLTIAGW
jgi:hypothetical protein